MPGRHAPARRRVHLRQLTSESRRPGSPQGPCWLHRRRRWYGRSRTRCRSESRSITRRTAVPASGPTRLAAVSVPVDSTPSWRPPARRGVAIEKHHGRPAERPTALVDVRRHHVVDVAGNQLVLESTGGRR
jgi:hypothetical protein